MNDRLGFATMWTRAPTMHQIANVIRTRPSRIHSLAVVVLAALPLAGCGAKEQQPPIMLDGHVTAVTYGRYPTEDVRGFLEPAIRTGGYDCGSLINALEVKVAGRKEPPSATYIQAYCTDGRVYQVAIFEPDRRTVVRPWSRQLISRQ
jgi:hypothetical protein